MPNALMLERVALAIVSSEPTGWKIPVSLAGSPDSTPNGTTSSISKSMASPILTLWVRPSSRTSIDARSPHAEVLADQRPERLHGPAELAAEHRAERGGLLVGGGGIDERAEAPVAIGHHFRGVRDRGDHEAADIGAVDVATLDVEDERDATAVEVGAERQRCGAGTDHVT
jgi:hypothetical protein